MADSTDTAPASSKQPALRMAGITKRFPGVVALDEVALEIAPGEVLAVIGENGAGKSTLMKILGGVHSPDEGLIEVDGTAVKINSVSEADGLGIGFVHQELNILDNLDVGANVFLGREPRRFGLINRRKIAQDTKPHLERLGLDIDPTTPVSRLSIAQQQMVEIAKALSKDARIIIMDEPTSSLTLNETNRLLKVIAGLRSEGIAVIYISHRLGEVIECADRVVALRDGQNAGELSKTEITHDAMVSIMVGRELTKTDYTGSPTDEENVRLSVSELRTTAYPQQSVDIQFHGGEIHGMAGLVGAGRSELAQAVFGVDPRLGGKVTADDKVIPASSVRSAITAGVYLVPEDRKASGVVLDFSISHNVSLASLGKHSRMGLIDRRSERIEAQQQMDSLAVKAPSSETPVVNLSGGNQQKVVLGKWLSMNPSIVIFDEPTRGIDVGAKAEIYRLMRELADRGVAIWMISSDMEEVLAVSDRISVVHEGRITGSLCRDEFSEEAVMQLAVGRERDAA